MRSLGASALLLGALAACADGSGGPSAPSAPIDLSAAWRTASPESQSIDAAKLADAAAHARTLPRLLSLLVVRHGRLVLEQYSNGNLAGSLNDVRSVTKSVVSTLVGIAIARGDLPGVEARLDGYLGPGHLAGLEPAKRAIRFDQLLTMSSGFQWDESTTAAYNAWVVSPDPIAYLLDRPLAAPPGQAFTYNTAAVHLLSVALQGATRLPTAEFAQRYLFAPLGITTAQWELFPDGQANGGAGLDLTARDLAKFGVLWLQRGDAGHGAIVPAGWVATATSARFNYWHGRAPLGEQSYGYLWWVNKQGGRTDFFAWGYGGQFVWVAPSLDLVIVVTTDWRGAGAQAPQLETNGLDLILNYVIPSVR